MSKPKHRTSIASIVANRANAQLSTGPRTPEGKTRSSQNARKHVFDPAAFPIVRFEDVGQIDRLRHDALAIYKPANSQEMFAVEQIALAQNALLRADRLISGLLTVSLNLTMTTDGRPMHGLSPHLVDEDHTIVQAQNRNFLLGQGFHNLVTESPSFLAAIRYQAHAERQYRRAVQDLTRLRKVREELESEPEFTPQLEEKPLLALVKNEPVSTHPPEHYGPDLELLPAYERPDSAHRNACPNLTTFPDPALPPRPDPF